MSHTNEYDLNRRLAERFIEQAADYDDPQISSARLAAAQVHATLAVAAATMALAESHNEQPVIE
ncbi:hypothetical protein ACWGKS_27055 [Nocardiopsis sp. NPDC055879]